MEATATNIGFKITSKQVFEEIFNEHYANLCAYANQFLKELEASEEVVQEVLLKLWTNRETTEITINLKSYLFRAVRNSCLNVIKHITIREEYKEHRDREMKIEEQNTEDQVIVSELEEKIRNAINQLPQERKKIFIMSRYDGLKYKEIAEKLEISIKTVENQMGSALKFLRTELADYMPWLLLFFSQLFKDQ